MGRETIWIAQRMKALGYLLLGLHMWFQLELVIGTKCVTRHPVRATMYDRLAC
jgi:hypothetical protein